MLRQIWTHFGKKEGFADPISIAVLGFLAISFVVGTVAIVRQGSFDIRERAAVLYPKFACQSNGQCIEDEAGGYATLSDCTANCQLPPPPVCSAGSTCIFGPSTCSGASRLPGQGTCTGGICCGAIIPQVCVPNSSKCITPTIKQQCNADGTAWSGVVPCEAGKECNYSTGQCEAPARYACNPQAGTCSLAVGGVFTSKGQCDAECDIAPLPSPGCTEGALCMFGVSTCSSANRKNGSGTCTGGICCGAAITINNCTEGERVCDGRGYVKVCKPDKSGYSRVACAGQNECSPEAGHVCIAPSCDFSGNRCSSDGVSKETCINGKLSTQVCGTLGCNSITKECNTVNNCTKGYSYCDPLNSNYVYLCKPDRSGYDRTQCATENGIQLKCQSGSITCRTEKPLFCEPTVKRCDPNDTSKKRVQACNASGAAYEYYRTCPENYICTQGGECVLDTESISNPECTTFDKTTCPTGQACFPTSALENTGSCKACYQECINQGNSPSECRGLPTCPQEDSTCDSCSIYSEVTKKEERFAVGQGLIIEESQSICIMCRRQGNECVLALDASETEQKSCKTTIELLPLNAECRENFQCASNLCKNNMCADPGACTCSMYAMGATGELLDYDLKPGEFRHDGSSCWTCIANEAGACSGEKVAVDFCQKPPGHVCDENADCIEGLRCQKAAGSPLKQCLPPPFCESATSLEECRVLATCFYTKNGCVDSLLDKNMPDEPLMCVGEKDIQKCLENGCLVDYQNRCMAPIRNTNDCTCKNGEKVGDTFISGKYTYTCSVNKDDQCELIWQGGGKGQAVQSVNSVETSDPEMKEVLDKAQELQKKYGLTIYYIGSLDMTDLQKLDELLSRLQPNIVAQINSFVIGNSIDDESASGATLVSEGQIIIYNWKPEGSAGDQTVYHEIMHNQMEQTISSQYCSASAIGGICDTLTAFTYAAQNSQPPLIFDSTGKPITDPLLPSLSTENIKEYFANYGAYFVTNPSLLKETYPAIYQVFLDLNGCEYAPLTYQDGSKMCE